MENGKGKKKERETGTEREIQKKNERAKERWQMGEGR